MDLLLSAQALIIAIIIGTLLSYSLNIKLPILIGLIIALLFALMWHLLNKYHNDIYSSLSLKPNIEPNPNPAPSKITPKAKEFKDTDNEEEDGLPFDNLEPSELMRRLNIIYTATSNPAKVAHHMNDNTSSDARLTADSSSLASASDLHLTYADWLYPQNTKKQVNTGDCTNYDSGSNSCIQSITQLNDYPLKACSKYNMPPDDYSKSMDHALIRAGGVPVLEGFVNRSNTNSLYYNAPSLTNKHARTVNLCRTCKIGICKHDLCI
jgi:hypothetical protein